MGELAWNIFWYNIGDQKIKEYQDTINNLNEKLKERKEQGLSCEVWDLHYSQLYGEYSLKMQKYENGNTGNFCKDKFGNYYISHYNNKINKKYYSTYLQDEDKKEELIVDDKPKYELQLCTNEEIRCHELFIYQKLLYPYENSRLKKLNEIQILQNKIKL